MMNRAGLRSLLTQERWCGVAASNRAATPAPLDRHSRAKGLLSLCADRRGSFAILFAVLLPLLLVVAGFAIDFSRALASRTHAHNAADAATLAAASRLAAGEITEEEAREMAQVFYLSNLVGHSIIPVEELDRIGPDVAVHYENEGGTRTAEVRLRGQGSIDAVFPVWFLKNAMLSYRVESVSRSSSETHSALSMYLVLDKSGSMAWPADSAPSWLCQLLGICPSPSKMDGLKDAVRSLTSQLADADPETKYVRMGAIAYDSAAASPLALEWGTAGAQNYVSSLRPEGNTDSSDAMREAYHALRNDRESREHERVNGQPQPARIIVFMTDGENNNAQDSTYTIRRCEDAKAAGIHIFSVAFMAPAKGREMLMECASSEGDYYRAEDSHELVAAFKTIGAKASDRLVRVVE